MKTRFLADFNEQGTTGYAVFKTVCAHNEGKVILTLQDIASIVRWQKVEYPSLLENLKIASDEKEGTLKVFENGEKLTYTITERKYVELDQPEPTEISENPVFQVNK